MSKYATLAQVQARYATDFLIRISNFTNEDDGSAIVAAHVDTALQDASDQINGYLQGRYPVPVSPAPDYFVSDTVKLAVKLLIERKGYDPESADAAHIKAGDEVIKKYTAVAQGDISITLPDLTGAAVPPVKIKTTAPDRMFTAATLDKY